MFVSFGDNVRIANTRLTTSLGLAGLSGEVRGETTPSVTLVEVIGEPAEDFAVYVKLDNRADGLWFDPQLVEFIDYGAGTMIEIANKRFTRSAGGQWVEETQQAAKPKRWWRFW